MQQYELEVTRPKCSGTCTFHEHGCGRRLTCTTFAIHTRRKVIERGGSRTSRLELAYFTVVLRLLPREGLKLSVMRRMAGSRHEAYLNTLGSDPSMLHLGTNVFKSRHLTVDSFPYPQDLGQVLILQNISTFVQSLFKQIESPVTLHVALPPCGRVRT